MDPIIAAGIGGLANVVGGLFGLKSQAKQRKLDARKQGLQAQQDAQKQAANTMAQGTSSSLANLMQAYQGLIR